MTTVWRIGSGGLAILVLLALAFGGRRLLKSSSASDADSASVVVLVDFSKSFIPSLDDRPRPAQLGLQEEDQLALHAVSEQLVLLASRYKTVKLLWFPIQATSPQYALCEPLEVTTSLVKHENRDGKATTKEDVEAIVGSCLSRIVSASKDAKNLADHTSVSGAVAMAAAATEGDYSHRVLVIFSDLKEDLATGMHPASFHLSKEDVILLHRPASDESLDVRKYLNRVSSWKEKLLQNGAATVTAMPLFSVSEARIRAALQPEEGQPRTSVTLLADFKKNIFPLVINGHRPDPDPLVAIGKAVADSASGWPQPVTAQWVVVADSGYHLRADAPVEFWQKLIKPPDLLSEVPDFARALEETSQHLPALADGVLATDLSGTIEIVASVEPAPKSNILVIVSDFTENNTPGSGPFSLAPGTRVVMLFKPSPEDEQNPDAGAARRARWASRLREGHASRVCQFPLVSWSPHDLKSCLAEESK